MYKTHFARAFPVFIFLINGAPRSHGFRSHAPRRPHPHGDALHDDRTVHPG